MPKYLTMLEGNEPEMLDASPRPSQRRQLPPVARRQQPAARNGIRSARIVYGCPCSGGVSSLLVGREVDELGAWYDNLGRKAWNLTKDIGHGTAEVARTVVPIAATGVGTVIGTATGMNAGGAMAGGGSSMTSMLPGLMDIFGFGGSSSGGGGAAPQVAGQPQQQAGLDPRLLYIGGGALLLVLLVRK